MYRHWVSALVLITCCFSVLSLAQDPPAAESEAVEGEATESKAKVVKQKDELQDTRTEVDKRENKVKSMREEIKKMIEEKNALPKSEVKQHSEIMRLIEETYRQYRTEYEELQKARTRLRFRFPDKFEKKPTTPEQKKKIDENQSAVADLEFESLEELETESGLDLELSNAITLMRSQYGQPVKVKAKKKKNSIKTDLPSDSEVITIQK